jgi:hypothetical protein
MDGPPRYLDEQNSDHHKIGLYEVATQLRQLPLPLDSWPALGSPADARHRNPSSVVRDPRSQLRLVLGDGGDHVEQREPECGAVALVRPIRARYRVTVTIRDGASSPDQTGINLVGHSPKPAAL